MSYVLTGGATFLLIWLPMKGIQKLSIYFFKRKGIKDEDSNYFILKQDKDPHWFI